MVTYTAKSLDEIAASFELRALNAKAHSGTKIAQELIKREQYVWRAAADILRKTTLEVE